MGGDHRCSVCQATFTRPQHVARHMRSHTGDRPYKCQYCGDQFARSDLLARHINKCHANEKPLPNTTTTGTRRKGSAAASRATTSKQACDQCVQSALPCDGSNPCSKCISRKCRCTYVKFHRQTAPTGPGHHPPRSPSSSSSSLSGSIGPPSRYPSHLDNFILAPPLSAPPVGTAPPLAAADQIFHTPFTFNPAAPVYPANWTAPDVTQLPLTMASEHDLVEKYRAQAEFFRRGPPSVLPNTSPAMLPGMYGPTTTQQQQQQQQQPPPCNWYPAWAESGSYPSLDDTKSFDGMARTQSLASSEPASFAPDFYGAGVIGSAYRPRRVSLDFSDSSSATSHSVPSSASSSSVHLPVNEMRDGSSEDMHDAHVLQHHRNGSLPTSQPPSYPGPSEPVQPPPPPPSHRTGEGGFSSAFGLMSIEDPNVLAGLSSDGVPFFSNLGVGVLPHSPNATPMPTRVHQPHLHPGRDRGMSLGALPTPGTSKEVGPDSRELKDMWKTFMRSPLSGSGSGSVDVSASHAHLPQSPSGQRRRMRVSSLPSVTPTVEKGPPLMMGGEVGTTVHGNPEDLRSYEEAVNARSASLKLNLVPRRKRTRPNNGVVGTSPPMVGVSCAGAGPVEQRISRPSSSSSTTSSSLAQVFGLAPHAQGHGHYGMQHQHGPVVVKPPPMQGASISLPIPPLTGLHASGVHYGHGHGHAMGYGSSTSLPFEPGSRASSVGSDGTGGTGGSGSDGEAMRPSFKRYPSQTLVPASSKRALVERRSGEAKGVCVVEEEGGRRCGGGEGMETEGLGEDGGVGAGSPGSRPIAALPERAKRV